MTRQRTPSYLNFDKHSYPWKPDIDYRKEPETYRVGKGEQGVLICEPYKSELTPHWRFKTPELANRSSAVLYQMFEEYLKTGDFVGADMARKFLQMGYTRARRYANYKGGIKYDKNNAYALRERGTGDPEKAESATIFHQKWKQAEAHPEYATRKKAWREQYG
ncbi:protein of unknown function [Nitrosospira sp. Nsp14]|uniref:DUF4385 domain-containing protein n=1 Tax=Nitrosospira sp. Nsp14 TaxID=1855333 RepID=UPI0008EB8DDB|nr:DUF4385 domain-containing protein [Nitrosospira sp. Nsp14]SFH28173.1 protein of unknown function [Nitrosospira sp. Nsp14]